MLQPLNNLFGSSTSARGLARPGQSHARESYLYAATMSMVRNGQLHNQTFLAKLTKLVLQQLQVPKLFDVKNRVALVTGGGSGLGEMMATTLVQNGAKVYIASRKESQLKEVSQKLQGTRTKIPAQHQSSGAGESRSEADYCMPSDH